MVKKVAVIFGVLLVTTNLVWAYIAFEQQVHISYLAGDVQSIRSQKDSFKRICDHIYSDLSIKQTENITKQLHPHRTFFLKEGALHVSGYYSIELNSQETRTSRSPCVIW